MPFRKGQGGRKVGARNRVTKGVLDVWDHLGGTDGLVYAQQLHTIAVEPHGDVHARLKALSLILAYKWGKPIERQEHSGPHGGALVWTWQLPQ